MASLVANYSDSDSESEDLQENTASELEQVIKIEPSSPSNSTSSKNFFTSADSDSGDDDQRMSHKFDPTVIKKEIKSEARLPNPLLGGFGNDKLPSMNEAASSRIGTCVFSNPFAEAEQAKFQILEKHVKLTAAAPKKPAHQPVCWKFKKGKCHMGKNCRFFHDTDNQKMHSENGDNTVSEDTNGALPVNSSHLAGSDRLAYHPAAYFDARRRPLSQDPEDEDHYMSGMRKKKRYGVCDNLLPPKKAFESLQRQRAKERPWTMQGLH